MHNENLRDKESEAGSLGELLREVRESKGLTLTEVCEGARVSRAFLWELETGRSNNPSTRTCRKLANFYGIKLMDLLGGQSSGKSAVIISKQQMLGDYESLPVRQQQEIAAVIRSLAESNRRGPNAVSKRLTRPRASARQQKEHHT